MATKNAVFMRLVAFCKRLGNTISCEERVANRFRYQGEQYDPITRQYYLRARYYNPVIGRFIQEDTYYGDGLNLYEYCRNNTITYKDPTGHNICPTQRDLYHKYKEEGMSPQEAYQKMRKELGLDSKSGYKDSGVGNGNDPWRSYESGSSSRYDRTGYQSKGRSNNLFGRDRSTRRTTNLTEWRRSISQQDIHNEMRLFLGDDYVKIDSGKWRSLDGTRQFRVKPDDYLGNHGIGQPTVPNTPHVHFEFLTPKSNGNGFDVIKNIHVPIK